MSRAVREATTGRVQTFLCATRDVSERKRMEDQTPTREKRWFHHQIIPLGDGVAVTSRDVTDRKQAGKELRALTLVDDLTRLYNRRGFRMLAMT